MYMYIQGDQFHCDDMHNVHVHVYLIKWYISNEFDIITKF